MKSHLYVCILLFSATFKALFLSFFIFLSVYECFVCMYTTRVLAGYVISQFMNGYELPCLQSNAYSLQEYQALFTFVFLPASFVSVLKLENFKL